MVVPVVQGIQSQQVAACVKHYAANNQELNRSEVDAQMDERTLREIYLPGFEAAVIRGKCLLVMGAYNKFRGQYCSHHEYLVNKILKGEWKFDGCFVSDWAAAKDTLQAALCGLDLEMGTGKPYSEYYLARPFREAVQSGRLNEALLDEKVRRNLRVMFRVGIFDCKAQFGRAQHRQASSGSTRNCSRGNRAFEKRTKDLALGERAFVTTGRDRRQRGGAARRGRA